MPQARKSCALLLPEREEDLAPDISAVSSVSSQPAGGLIQEAEEERGDDLWHTPQDGGKSWSLRLQSRCFQQSVCFWFCSLIKFN